MHSTPRMSACSLLTGSSTYSHQSLTLLKVTPPFVVRYASTPPSSSTLGFESEAASAPLGTLKSVRPAFCAHVLPASAEANTVLALPWVATAYSSGAPASEPARRRSP